MLPQAQVSAEGGQINSAYTDYRFGLSQSAVFPTVYAAQRNVLEGEWSIAVLSASLSKAELRRRVTELFYHHLLLREEEQLLRSTDTIYADFAGKARLRYKSGESNIAEKSSAEAQRSGIWLQLRALQNELALNSIRLQLLMNTALPYEPAQASLKYEPNAGLDSAAVSVHPALRIYKEQTVLAAALLKLERARLLPEMNIGYYNQSIRGMGADDNQYNAATRFHAMLVGVGIPIFSAAQRANVRAARTQVDISETAYQLRRLELQSEWNEAWTNYRSSLEMVAHIENSLLPNAQIIIETAGRQFSAGEINYLEWTILVNQAIQLRRDYLAALGRSNEAAIKITYLAYHE
jgi:cobalt-zinc-cadmium resistance protein CzcA